VARILVAEDRAEIRDRLASALEGAGYEVVRAADGQEALRVFADERPDLAIVDIFMPLLDGIEVIRAIRRDAPGTRIVALSAGWSLPNLTVAFPEYDVLDDARALGADATLTKPVAREELLGLVGRLLGGAAGDPA
jgi:CheY-like chemotaxis protein